MQDAAQVYHWNNSQVTIHPVVVYYKNNEKTDHLCLAVISDCLTHDTVAVCAFQKTFVDEIKETLPFVTKLYYFSDGCGAQYKNYKNFANLRHHKQDFKIDAEWHFFCYITWQKCL